MKLHDNRTVVFYVQSLFWEFESNVNSALSEAETKAVATGHKFLIYSKSAKCPSGGKKAVVTRIILLLYIQKKIPTHLKY